MANPYVGEIRMFGGNFAPLGWAFCNGQLLAISGNETLFNLIGTTYGGDGVQTFALPNLCGRVPVHQGNLQGVQSVIGQMAGTETVTLTSQQIPIHTHTMQAANVAGDQNGPGGRLLAAAPINIYNNPSSGFLSLNSAAVSMDGGNQPHENCQPFLVINFIISLFGLFPSQT